MKLKGLFWAIVFLLFMIGTAWGEIYQYTDDSGVVRFTDDSSLIPDDQRSNVQTIESVNSDFVPEKISSASRLGVDSTPAEEIRNSAHELDALGEELMGEYKTLQAEKEALGEPPSYTAKTAEKTEYDEKVKEMNRKIDQYEVHKKEYQEKVNAFNSKIGQD